ncbi:MAG: hypothetical protein BV456_11165 [Thermoplasmata archaeon M8B2D]|nr:MAG: hypothetical protein BV456_11165 [Thermoplasmata archaeon M8B2D]
MSKELDDEKYEKMRELVNWLVTISNVRAAYLERVNQFIGEMNSWYTSQLKHYKYLETQDEFIEFMNTELGLEYQSKTITEMLDEQKNKDMEKDE